MRLAVTIVLSALSTTAVAQSDSIAVGGDVSFLQRIEDHGGTFSDGGVAGDALEIFRNAGHDLMRLRIWHTPPDGYSGLDTTLALAHRLENAGHRWILDFHYSDSWADPGKQNKPAAWSGAPFEALVDSVYNYTKRILEVLRIEGVTPDYVQIGNEITSGTLWPDAHVGGANDNPAQWTKFAQILDAGIRGARDGAAPDSIRTIIHIDRGADVTGALWFFDNLTSRIDTFDAIGLSFYPFWHGTIDRFQYNLETLGERYGKEILVVEVAYPWTLEWFDNQNNIIGSVDPQLATWPTTPEGQADFLRETATIVRCSPTGSALVYWEPEHISSGFPSPWENMTLFDQNGETLPGLFSMADDSTECRSHYATVRLPLNVASIPDTVGPTPLQIRGAVDGFAPHILSDGTRLDWENTQVSLTHVGGDYYEAEFLAPTDRELQFKFWSAAINNADFNFGWDLGETNGHPDGNSVLTVSADTTLPLHFFNAVGARKPYASRPWTPKPDTVAVWFRVYMRTYAAANQGYAASSPFVAGSDAEDGPLAEPIALARERNVEGTAGYDLYSGVAYFPQTDAGASVPYRFCVSESACEESVGRMFTLPAADTTLQWVRYANSPPIPVGVDDEPRGGEINELYGVFPNPATDAVSVDLQLASPGAVRFELYDSLGRAVAVLDERTLGSARQTVDLDLPELPSGLYFVVVSPPSAARMTAAVVVQR